MNTREKILSRQALVAELAALTGRDRRALYARRDRGQRRLCA